MAAAPNPRSIFAFTAANPYDKNHLLRLGGALAAFFLAALNSAVLVFYYSADSNVKVNSRWGLFLVVIVDGWLLTWFQLKTHLCSYAENPKALAQYEWRDLFESAYGAVDRSKLCDEAEHMLIIAMACCFVAVASALASVAFVVLTRLRGNPELRAQQHYDHCKTGMMVMAFCMFGTILPPIIYAFTLPDFVIVEATPVKMREGVFVGVISGLALISAIMGYHIDRSVLQSKMEFEKLVWASLQDDRLLLRQQMAADADALEAAKFGGLQTPAQLARQVNPENRKGVDKFLFERAGPWRW
ncbi:hypothetical protein, conserved [Eimeria necatrix]|uniref:Uncharacterized protein n=1 Tax=Eimeria necatrix TaxID=51315 RepID=U6MMC3_9EIME|nr:hypothetical protein, conserved [Eimeria necatrix]CDJ65392.1 hypothetical protein, conserved [Eimeria necatrix]